MTRLFAGGLLAPCLLLRVQPATSDMTLFERFVNSNAYPPYFEQPKDRVYSGSLGNPNVPNTRSGARDGLENVHILTNSSSCHTLPEGGNNLIVLHALCVSADRSRPAECPVHGDGRRGAPRSAAEGSPAPPNAERRSSSPSTHDQPAGTMTCPRHHQEETDESETEIGTRRNQELRHRSAARGRWPNRLYLPEPGL